MASSTRAKLFRAKSIVFLGSKTAEFVEEADLGKDLKEVGVLF